MLVQESSTHATLLLQLRDLSDHAAWGEFLQRYGPRIYGWCRRQRLQEADAADVTQEVLGKLVGAMHRFDYDPARGSFRGWLKTVTRNAIHDLIAGGIRPDQASGGPGMHERLQTLQAPEAVDELHAELEAEARLEVLREAESRVRLRVQPQTWQAYHQTAVERQPPGTVAGALGMPVSEVYVAKSRVLKMLREEIDKLNPPEM
jgi:RNA polymerase sigma-70 factor, ECF subfamily